MINEDKKVVAVVIARGGSKSIPRKNVQEVAGKPLVAWPVDLAKSVSRIDRVIISTDDDEIADIAVQHGAEKLFTRPEELSSDEVSTLPVLRHAVSFLEKQEQYKADIVLLLYPTAPFLSKKRIEEALDMFESSDCNSVISVVKDWGRFWKGKNDSYVPLYPKERLNRQYYEPLLREDGSAYFSRYNVLMHQNKLVDEKNVRFLIMKEGENVDIDNPEDLKEAQRRVM